MNIPSEINPTSLLWAHEMRRENIHLLNQILATQTALSTTTNTTHKLEQTNKDLTESITKLSIENRDLDIKLRDIHVKLNDLDKKTTVISRGVENAITTANKSNESRESESVFTDAVLDAIRPSFDALNGHLHTLEGKMVEGKEMMNKLEKQVSVVATPATPMPVATAGIPPGIENLVRDMVLREMERMRDSSRGMYMICMVNVAPFFFFFFFFWVPNAHPLTKRI